MVAERCIRRTPWRRVLGDRRRPRDSRLSPWLRALRGQPGVYLLRDGERLYVGEAADLYGRVRRHFYPHKAGIVTFDPSVTEARVYVMDRDLLDEAEARLIAQHPDAINVVGKIAPF